MNGLDSFYVFTYVFLIRPKLLEVAVVVTTITTITGCIGCGIWLGRTPP